MIIQGSPAEKGLTTEEAHRRLASAGPNEVPEEPPHFLRSFARRFWGPVSWMLEVALAIEVILGKVPESVIILALLLFNAILAQVQESRSQEALQLLRHKLRVTARVLRDGAWVVLPARELVPGDHVHLRMGDIVPSDGKVVEGEIEVDQSAITGESAAVSRGPGTALYSASIVRRGEASADVTATGSKSYYGKTAELVRSARGVSHLETLLFDVVRYLVILDALLSVIVVGVAELRGVPLLEVVPFILILLVASVPVALPATFTIANALEARRLVEEGILVTGLTAIQEAASMDILCVDKTGTLTEGRETLEGVTPLSTTDEATVLRWAGAACDASTQDTIDLAILAAIHKRNLPPLPREKFTPFDPAQKRSEAVVKTDQGSQRVVLGFPSVVSALCAQPPPGMPKALEQLTGTGARVLAVAAGAEGHLEMIGLVALADPPRGDAVEMIQSLQKMGIRVLMLTGDGLSTAKAVAAKVGLGARFGERAQLTEDPSLFDGFAGVYPEDKYAIVQALQGRQHSVGMTGDGVNDAPALKQAEVGIAVSSATDVARASAKLVLTRPGLRDIASAVGSGRRVYRRMLTWTVNKVAKNLQVVLLLTVGFLVTGLFVTTPFLILAMVFANDFVTMSVAGDNARTSSAPDHWRIREIVGVASVIATPQLFLSFALLWWALALAHLGVAEIQTLFFVYLVFSSQVTILVVRESDRMWTSRPGTPLLVAIAADLAVVSLLAVSGTLMAPVPAEFIIYLLGIVAVTTVAIDYLKVWFLRRTGAFGSRTPTLPGQKGSTG